MGHVSIVRQAALALCAAWLLLGSTAHADQILIAKAQGGLNRTALYIKYSSGGPCDYVFPGWVNGSHSIVEGSPNADVIVLFDSGAPITWCDGLVIQPMTDSSHSVDIYGMEGEDVIWGGKGGGVKVGTLNGSNGWAVPADTTRDWVFGGPFKRIFGGDGSDVIFVKAPGANVYSRGGHDLICTQVDSQYFTFGTISIEGGSGTDGRYGPQATTELSIQRSNDANDGQWCGIGYNSIVASVFAMLAGG